MLHWICLNIVPLSNMLGISMDMVGAYFVAYEVVRKFQGEKYEASIGSSPIGSVPTNDPPTEAEPFRLFESRRFRNMKIGLFFLTFGFILQFLANAMQLK